MNRDANESLARLGKAAVQNCEVRGTPLAAGPLDQQTQRDSAGNEAARKAFEAAVARLATRVVK